MDIPEWVARYVLSTASPVEGRLLLALFVHGKPVVGPDGSRRIYWRVATDRMSHAAASSLRGTIAARRQLVEAGIIAVHEPNKHKAPGAISAPVEAPVRGAIETTQGESWGATIAPQQIRRGATSAGQAESGSAHHDDDLSTPTPTEEIRGSSSSSPILGELAEIGVTDPGAMVKLYGEHHCRQALERLREAEATANVRNPAGLLRHLAATQQTPYRAVSKFEPEDQFEATKRRFLGGALGHIVRYR